ncbi:hypothetical protein MLD38_024169 [Melastoma candidum]|uniref:Uncharacterized protein n=1 Tax=Melastoma candidum TaxID=119954 RepID=A0ACB9NRH9_9MYRT|nr:hypothetical protein MLD38_024169 [Melastoma candidum]
MSSRKGDEVSWMVQQRKMKYDNHNRDEEVTCPPPQQQRPLTLMTALRGCKEETKVSVVYYVSRDGNLEQPHFMEVTLSSPSDGLYLRDVIARMNFLRGRGLAEMYSWSSKRNYKSGYVWQDLSEDDLIHPCNEGQEYVLKGSELHRPNQSRSIRSQGTSTQTDEKRFRKRGSSFGEEPGKVVEGCSPPRPRSSSSNEEGAAVKVGYDHRKINRGSNEGERGSGRMKAASSALIHLVSCGPKGVGVVDSIGNLHV